MINTQQTPDYLNSLQAVRLESQGLYEKILNDESKYYKLDLDKLRDVARIINEFIDSDYDGQYTKIRPHGRWRHIPEELVLGLEPDQVLDMFAVSVLLDAGAGAGWVYRYANKTYSRSEGIAVAVAVGFRKGLFSGAGRAEVDADGLKRVSADTLGRIFQADDKNNVVGMVGRAHLLNRLAGELESNPVFPNRRPSGFIQILPSRKLDVEWFWKHVIISGYGNIWPCPDTSWCELTGRFIPFHKLSQWLCYSLLEPLERLFSIEVTSAELQTGLAEYRNGGLFIDHNVVIPKFDTGAVLSPQDQEVVEWRALTVVLLDRLHQLHFPQLTLTQLLEAGTWKAGRQVARQKRLDGSPPLIIESSGTLF